MIRVLIKPAKRLFGGRRQWKFEIRAANGERIDPRDTYANREDAIRTIRELLGLTDMTFQHVELVLYDRFGNIEDRRKLR